MIKKDLYIIYFVYIKQSPVICSAVFPSGYFNVFVHDDKENTTKWSIVNL